VETGLRAKELFESGFYCAESVLLAVAEEHGIESGLLPRIATGFCGGMARTCGQCGAVSGAVMAVGMLKGRILPTDTVDQSYEISQKLIGEFKQRFGSLNCLELTGCDLSTDQGRLAFREQKKSDWCVKFVEEAARITAKLVE
jgi:C_GCAxxG_C_C family probable redox protein